MNLEYKPAFLRIKKVNIKGDMQIKTIHGVPIPPKKKKLHRKDAQTIDFVITGVIPSKKNRQIATINRKKLLKVIKDWLGAGSPGIGSLFAAIKEVKPYIRHSKKFQAWEEEKKALIVSQACTWSDRLRAKGYEFSYPISEASITIDHYWKDDRIRDNSNKSETIHDILVSAGVLAGDNWQCLTPTHADADLYEGEITDHITVIRVTAYNWLKKK